MNGGPGIQAAQDGTARTRKGANRLEPVFACLQLREQNRTMSSENNSTFVPYKLPPLIEAYAKQVFRA